MKRYQDIPGDGGSRIVEQVTEQAERLKARLAPVKHILAVMSGKGGVGKSSLTVNLAAALAMNSRTVGILDADINGPSIARMTGVKGQPLSQGESGIRPAVADLNIRVMSIDLFLPHDNTPVLWEAPTQKDAYTWRGMMEVAALREFLRDTEWGELDYLLIDLPPGTDKLPNLVDVLPRLSGCIVVTIPSGVSQLVVRKSLTMATGVLKAPVLGLVENMSAYVCPHCGQEEPMFPAGQGERLAAEMEVPFLGKIPFDPRLALAGDEGHFFVNRYPKLPAAQAIHSLAEKIETALSGGSS
ncbi:MAG: ATP-binding protein [Calditrichaeota bacterium]|nr:MAG: ATP-binding protein [Calditrichota bacterium]